MYFFVLCSYYATSAQNLPTDDPQTTEYVRRDAELWGHINIESYLKGGSFFFAQTNWRYSTFQYAQTLPSTPFYALQQTLGYEQYLDKNWAVGFSVKGVFEKTETQLFSQAYLVHVSSISKQQVELIKTLSYERIDTDHAYKKTDSRITLGLALSKNFAIRQQTRLRPTLAYDMYMYHHWLLSSHELYNRRTIDLARFRAEMAVFLSKNLSLSLYYMAQTNYFVAEPEFGDVGGVIKETKPLRNLNQNTAIFGMRLHLQLFKNKVPENIRLRFLGY